MGSSAATPASADCSTYSPHSQGLRPSSRVFTRSCLPRRALSSAARRASLGVSCPAAHPDPRVHSRGGSTPRYVPASRFLPPRRFPPREPSRPCFMPERPWALPSRGFLLRNRRRLSRGPITLTTLAARRLRTSRRQRSHRLGARPASPSSGLPVPGVRSPQPAARPTPLGNDPLLGFLLPGASSASRRTAPIGGFPSWAS
jgi:hypothetical protein